MKNQNEIGTESNELRKDLPCFNLFYINIK